MPCRVFPLKKQGYVSLLCYDSLWKSGLFFIHFSHFSDFLFNFMKNSQFSKLLFSRFALPEPPEPWKEPLDCSKKIISTRYVDLPVDEHTVEAA
jgi:hypothetical protein